MQEVESNGFSIGLNNRLKIIKDLQRKLIDEYGSDDYNVFLFGSYLTERFVEGSSDVDIAVFTKNLTLYTKIACTIEVFFDERKIKSDIFYINTNIVGSVYCAPLQSVVRFTDYYPEDLNVFLEKCIQKAAMERQYH